MLNFNRNPIEPNTPSLCLIMILFYNSNDLLSQIEWNVLQKNSSLTKDIMYHRCIYNSKYFECWIAIGRKQRDVNKYSFSILLISILWTKI